MGTRFMRWMGIGALALSATALAGTADAQAPDGQTGTIRVVHGLRGLVADIYLNGELALPTFQPERATDPLTVPAGDHLVEIRSAGAAMTETPLLTQTVNVPAGFSGSLVAHLDADGNPTLTSYPDDLTAVPAGQTRVVVRHAAAASPISVLLNDQAAFAALSPKTETASILNAGNYKVAVTPTTGGEPLAAPQDVSYAEGTANFMYLIGSEQAGTLGWAAVSVGDLQTAPALIQTGDGSTMSGNGADNELAVNIAAAVAAALGATLVLRSRRTAPVS